MASEEIAFQSNGEVEAAMRALKTDRLIKIYIADSTDPYLIPQSSLVRASDYFAKAIKNGARMGKDGDDTLRFPEDSEGAWTILILWITREDILGPIIQGELAEQAMCILLVKTWVLADKYLMPKLQDRVMMMIMNNMCGVKLETMLTCIEIAEAGTPLRRAFIETMSYMLYPEQDDLSFNLSKMRISTHELTRLGGIPGALGDILQVRDRLVELRERNPNMSWNILGYGEEHATVYARWTEFMVQPVPEEDGFDPDWLEMLAHRKQVQENR